MFKLELENIPKEFVVTELSDNIIELKMGSSKPIKINIPFVLDENIAKISAMIMDGCISKNLASCMFSQKKDSNKVNEFGEIVNGRFYINCKYFIGNNNTPCVRFCSKTLCNFLYYCVDIHKSDEDARIPKWIWGSPHNVIKTYLRYVFAMEGSVSDITKGRKEIRFHSVDKSYLIQLQKLLENKFSIISSIYKYFVEGYGSKYYLSITKKEYIIKFRDIGIELKTHQDRLDKIFESYKNKAWEVTLVTLLKFENMKFHIKDVNLLFPYLHKRAIHARLTDLVRFDYLRLHNGPYQNGYCLTELGKNKAMELLPSVKITRIYTNHKENENFILSFLRNRKASISQIARELGINVNTVRDVLKRLEKQNKVKLIEVDKFQRKIWKINSGDSPEPSIN